MSASILVFESLQCFVNGMRMGCGLDIIVYMNLFKNALPSFKNSAD